MDAVQAMCSLGQSMRENNSVRDVAFGQSFGALKSTQEKKDTLWKAICSAHDLWRSQVGTLESAKKDEYSIVLNAFVRIELAGPLVFDIWADQFMCVMGFYTLVDNLARTELHKSLPIIGKEDSPEAKREKYLHQLFIEKRRSFIERNQIAGKGDLYRYVSSAGNQMFGERTKLCPAAARLAIELSTAVHTDTSLSFRLARQIIVANGGGSPIDW